MNISLTCPICHNEDNRLDIDVTIVHDTQGEPPYTGPLTTLDDYIIAWAESGHAKCEQLYNWLDAASKQAFFKEAVAIDHWLRKFEDAIFSTAIDAEADYDD